MHSAKKHDITDKIMFCFELTARTSSIAPNMPHTPQSRHFFPERQITFSGVLMLLLSGAIHRLASHHHLLTPELLRELTV